MYPYFISHCYYLYHTIPFSISYYPYLIPYRLYANLSTQCEALEQPVRIEGLQVVSAVIAVFIGHCWWLNIQRLLILLTVTAGVWKSIVLASHHFNIIQQALLLFTVEWTIDNNRTPVVQSRQDRANKLFDLYVMIGAFRPRFCTVRLYRYWGGDKWMVF